MTSGSSVGNIPFHHQTLVTVLEKDQTKKSKKPKGGNKYFPTTSMIDAIFASDRNANGQLYMLQHLKKNGHYSTGTELLSDSMLNSSYFMPGIAHDPVPFIHIPSDTNYSNNDNSMMVINHDQLRYDDIGLDVSIPYPITRATDIVERMFSNGIEMFFEYDVDKRVGNTAQDVQDDDASIEDDLSMDRGSEDCLNVEIPDGSGIRFSGTVKQQSLPQIAIGWTTQDCNKYNENASTIMGNVKPFLKQSNIPVATQKDFIHIVELLLKFFPEEHAFNPNRLKNTTEREYRIQMFKEFKRHLGGDEDVQHFRVEGITLLVPISLGWHRDKLNDTRDGFQTVMSVNVQVPINKKTMPLGMETEFGKFLKVNGYLTSFPCSIILYSKECVGGYCERMGKSDELASKDILRRLVKFGLVDRVGDIVDYRNQVFFNNLFPAIFNKVAKHAKKTRNFNFEGRMWERTACYDRSVSSSVFCIMISLRILGKETNYYIHYQGLLSILVHAYLDIHRNVTRMNVKSTIEYCCFATLVCQGTSGIAEIHRCMMDDPELYQSLYNDSCSENFFHFMRACWREVMPGRTLGASCGKRFTFPNCKTDFSELSSDILDVFKNFYANKKIRKRKILLDETFAAVLKSLRDDKVDNRMVFPGMGKFTTVLFLQLASLLGLIPLYCYSLADIKDPDLGPGSLIRIASKNPKKTAEECNEVFKEIRLEFEDIWGAAVTLALVENMCCELYRSFVATIDSLPAGKMKNKRTITNYYSKNNNLSEDGGLAVLLDNKQRVESKFADIFYHDESRDCVQNLFMVRQTGSGESELRPMLLMRHSLYAKLGRIDDSIVKLTNWVQDKNDPKHISWSVPPDQITLETPLVMSDELSSMMKINRK